MHIFTIMYLMGLLLGIGFYALTFFFSQVLNYKKRALIVGLIGVATLVGSLIIGGFSGMPFGLLSLGILTIFSLIAILGKTVLLQKLIFTIIVLFVVSFGVFTFLNKPDYWIINKTNENTYGEIEEYLEKLEKNPKMRGYNILTISEGNKAVILSLGEEMAGNNIEVLNVEEQTEKTIISVRTFYNKSTENNPSIIIGLDRIKSNIEIRDTNGTLYQNISN